MIKFRDLLEVTNDSFIDITVKESSKRTLLSGNINLKQSAPALEQYLDFELTHISSAVWNNDVCLLQVVISEQEG